MDIDWKRKAMDVPVIGSRRPRSSGRPRFLCCLWYRYRHKNSRHAWLGHTGSFGHDQQVLLKEIEQEPGLKSLS